MVKELHSIFCVPFPLTPAHQPTKDSGLSRVAESPKARARLLEIRAANMGVGALDLLNQGKRSGDPVADPGKTQEKNPACQTPPWLLWIQPEFPQA